VNERRAMLWTYSVGHFFVDFACAFLVLGCSRAGVPWQTALLLYNFFAFAVQMPLGLLTDRFGNGRGFAAGGCLLVAAAGALRQTPLLLCVVAGLGNALFHIGGGHDVLGGGDGRAGALGVFVSPGAFGLFLGGLLRTTACPVWPVSAALLLCAAAILRLCPRTAGGGVSLRSGAARPPGAAALLVLVVCLRSYGGFLFRFPWKEGAWAWVFVLSVVLGKTAGGLLYDRFGGRKTAIGSLLPAAALFLFSDRPAAGCAAVLLFNMTMPVTLRAAADLFPRARGFSFGLLTFALFLGLLPAVLSLPAPSGAAAYAAVCLLSLAALLPALDRRRV